MKADHQSSAAPVATSAAEELSLYSAGDMEVKVPIHVPSSWIKDNVYFDFSCTRSSGPMSIHVKLDLNLQFGVTYQRSSRPPGEMADVSTKGLESNIPIGVRPQFAVTCVYGCLRYFTVAETSIEKVQTWFQGELRLLRGCRDRSGHTVSRTCPSFFEMNSLWAGGRALYRWQAGW